VSRRMRRLAIAWAVAGACLGAVDAAAQRVITGRILVVPFETSREPRATWLGEGVALLLADGLNALGADAIARDERVRAFERLQVPPHAPLTRGTIIRIGQLLGATTVVSGRIDLVERRVAVLGQVLRIDTGRLSGEFDERGPIDELPAMVERAARRLAPAGGASAPLPPRPSMAAFEQFVKGLVSGSPKTQIGFFEKALSVEPWFERAKLALSRAHAALGAWDKTRELALAVSAESIFGDRAQFEAGVAEIHLKQFDAAFTRLTALAERTMAPETYNNLGIVQLRRGPTAQQGKATYYFNKAVDADPAAADYAFNLGYAYWREQDIPAAIYWMRETVRRDPADSDAHVVLAAALEASGAGTEAARERDLARKLSAAYEEQSARGSAEAVPAGLERLRPYLDPPGARRADAALMATEQRGQRELVEFHLERGRRFFQRESDRDALTELQRAIYLSPYLAEAHLLVGRIHLRAGRVAEAVEAFKIALWSDTSADAHVALAEAYRQARDLAGARREAEQALKLAPGHPEATALLQKLQ
jgi:tetratricopeptide (TPR) repeat protein